MSGDDVIRLANRGMVGFDLVLGTATIAAPAATMRVLGHERASADAQQLFRRCGPIWLTFAAAHLAADRRGRPEDWWALAWLRATEWFTDAVWAASPAVPRRRAKAALVAAGLGNIAMSAAFASRARR